jgi:hypothetical protein
MRNSWLLIALFSGVLTGLITFFLTDSWKLSWLAGMLITIPVMINNPNRRFLKAFWVMIFMIVVVNKYFLKLIGEFSGISFKFESELMGNLVITLLVLLSCTSLLLDYVEKSGKGISFFVSVNKNDLKKFTNSGDNIQQQGNKEVNRNNG